MVIHGYIGRNGAFMDCQMKSYKEGQKNGQQMEVTPFLKKMIYTNSLPALRLAEKLLVEKHSRYLKAAKNSYEIERKLNELL